MRIQISFSPAHPSVVGIRCDKPVPRSHGESDTNFVDIALTRDPRVRESTVCVHGPSIISKLSQYFCELRSDTFGNHTKGGAMIDLPRVPRDQAQIVACQIAGDHAGVHLGYHGYRLLDLVRMDVISQNWRDAARPNTSCLVQVSFIPMNRLFCREARRNPQRL